MYNKNTGTLCEIWSRWALSTFDVLNGHTTSKKNPWRFRIILMTATTMATLAILMLYNKTILVYPRISRASTIPDVTQIINDYLQFSVDLYYINKYDRDAHAEYYRKYLVIDTSFNRHPDVKEKLIKLIAVFILIWFINFAVHYTTLWYEFYWQYPIIFVPFHLFAFAKILTTLFMSAHTVRIECRMRMIGDSVDYKMGEGWQNMNVLNEDRKFNERNKNSSKKDDEHKPLKSWLYRNRNIPRLSEFYLILTEQVNFVNKMFGIRILFLSLNLTIDMVRFINSLYRYVSGKQFTNKTNAHKTYSLGAASITRTLVCVAMLSSLVHHCERVYRQTDRIVRLCDRVLITRDSNEGEEVRTSLSELRELAVSRPASFHVARFFRLEYPALTAVAATVVSYSIILFQSM